MAAGAVQPEKSVRDENGLFHCTDGPAVVHTRDERVDLTSGDGRNHIAVQGPVELWYYHGDMGRVGGPALIVGASKTEVYCLNGKIFGTNKDDAEYLAACDSFCKLHRIVTNRAQPN